MQNKANYKLKLGMFAVIGGIIFLVALFFIGKQKNLFGNTIRISAVFKTVSGLKIGNNVRVGGINIGTIDDIQLITDTSVKVDMIIQKAIQKFIKKDAIVTIGSDGLMGDRVMTITPGTPGQEIIKDGGMLGSRTPVEAEQIMSSLKVSADNAAIITDQLAEISTKINNGHGTLSKLIADSTMATNLSNTINNLKKGSKGLDENMEAAKHNFLLKGYFKKKKKEEEKKKEEQSKNAKEPAKVPGN